MITEIKRKLSMGEAVELECVDKNGFIGNHYKNANKIILNRESLMVESVSEARRVVFLEKPKEYVSKHIISFDELKYFKIKDQKPTFDGLIDVTVQAYKDGNVDEFMVGYEEGIECVKVWVDTDRYTLMSDSNIEECVRFIESLYTETFVIENECDCEKFKGVVESLVLSNGEDIIDDVKFHRNHPYFTTDMMGVYKLPFKLLKGATVTQTRGYE